MAQLYSFKFDKVLSHIQTRSLSLPLALALILSLILFVGLVGYKMMELKSSRIELSSAATQKLGARSDEAADYGAQEDGTYASGAVQEGTQVQAEVAPPEPPREIYVHVDGQVANPGLYKLAEGVRVDAAIKAAGGLLPDASLKTLNLAGHLHDGMKVYIPAQGEDLSALNAQEAASGITGESAPGIQGDNAQAAASSKTAGSKVNINTASASELEKLKGIGKKTAEAIVKDRQSKGPFKNAKDISRVSGIGIKKYEQIKDEITV